MSKLDLKKLTELDDHGRLTHYFEDQYPSNKYGNVLFILMNFDLVVLMNKLNKLSNSDYRKKYESLLQPEPNPKN